MEKNKVVLTGTYKGSYEQLRKTHNSDNKKDRFKIIKLFLKRLKIK
jgi:hypothetical protein